MPSQGETTAAGAGVLEITAILRALRRRWLLALSLALLVGGIGALATWTYQTPSPYLARALLHVAATPPQVMAGTGEPRADFVIYRQTQLALFKSRRVFNAVLQDPEVAELPVVKAQSDPVAWLERELKAEYPSGGEILRVSLKGNEPHELTTLVDGLVKAYLHEVVLKEQEKRAERLTHLQQLHDAYEASLSEKQARLVKLARAAGSNDSHVLAIKHELALKRLHAAQEELLQGQSRLTRQEVELSRLLAREESLDESAISEADVDEAMKKDLLVAGLLAEIAELEVILENIRRVAIRRETDPSYEKYQAAILRSRKSLAERREKLRPAVMKELMAKAHSRVRSEISQTREQIALLREHTRVLAEQTERLGQEPRALNESSLGLENLRAEITDVEGITKRLAGEMETLKVEVHAPARVTLLENAVITPTTEERRRALMTAFAGVAGIAVAVMGVVALECGRGKVGNVRHAVKQLNLKLLGSVPHIPAAGRHELVSPQGKKSEYTARSSTESIDKVRTVLLHALQQNNAQLLMVASAVEGEGKSTIAVGLAASLARAGFRTLLVDGDLRRPSVHELLNFPAAPGLCEYLRGAPIDSAVRPTSLERLEVLPAGEIYDAALLKLSSLTGPSCLAELKSSYDYIVFDSAPVLAVADPLLLARHVDGVVLSLLRDVSQLPDAVAGCELLRQVGVPIFGVVVQGVESTGYGDYYHASYERKNRLHLTQ